MGRKLTILGGIAGSLALGVFCLPAGIATAVATTLYAGITEEDRLSRSGTGTCLSPYSSFAETLPTGFEGIGSQVQDRVHDIALAEAYELALQAAAAHKDAEVQVEDLGNKIIWSVYTGRGRLIEHGEIDVPLR